MTGLERNAEVVNMASYAPLLAHVDAWQWRPDLIWFDNLQTIGTPNYYVQKIFSTHRGTQVIPVLEAGKPLVGTDSLFASASIDKNSAKVYIKLVNVSSSIKNIRINLEGLSILKNGEMETLKSKKLYEYNTVENPRRIYPVFSTVTVSGRKISINLDPRSVNVMTLGYKK